LTFSKKDWLKEPLPSKKTLIFLRKLEFLPKVGLTKLYEQINRELQQKLLYTKKRDRGGDNTFTLMPATLLVAANY
jgi:hypothetical protein